MMYFPIGNITFLKDFSLQSRELSQADIKPKGSPAKRTHSSPNKINQSMSSIRLNHVTLLNRPNQKSTKSTSAHSQADTQSKDTKKSTRQPTTFERGTETMFSRTKIPFSEKTLNSNQQLKKISRLRLRQPESDKRLQKSIRIEKDNYRCTSVGGETVIAKRYQIQGELGRGSYGVVYKCKDILSTGLVAIKEFVKGSKQSTQRFEGKLKKEVSIMSGLGSCKHIAAFHRYIHWEGRHFMVMQYCQGNTLKQFVRRTGKLSEEHTKPIARCLANALLYCHTNRIAHRDIKLENVMVLSTTETLTAKLIDFGFSCLTNYAGEKLRSYCGTPLYMAPEIGSRVPYDPYPADCWALGVVLYYMIAGQHPFVGKEEMMLYHQIQQAAPSFGPQFSNQLKKLLTGLLCKQPENRWSIRDVLQSEWLRSEDE